MGGTTGYTTEQGISMQQAFKIAQEKATSEYGYDPYNGEINNASLKTDFTRLMTFKEWEKHVGNKIHVGEKGIAWGYCIRKPVLNTNKIKSIVTRIPQKGARKWVTIYEVEVRSTGERIGYNNNLANAIKSARSYTEKNQMTTIVYISKKLMQGENKCATIVPKKASNQKLGIYAFFYYVSC